DVLTEVSNEEEAIRAGRLGAKIIGINNRNLRDLSTDLATTETLTPLLPEDALIISESGIYTHQDVLRLAPLADGFLVGSSIMAQQDLTTAVQQLLFGKVKVCGLTS
ncbi:bifunctional indole-3-glycerol phosphate synthase/phosphoribosylanthranilate isomerase, partial [Bowmanella dokdonensis]|nr:bifunctional indole-3-glycerol phosphate synthase/phosphoribosylanthranilate isomerase [Bowmanella dokdonensis]